MVVFVQTFYPESFLEKVSRSFYSIFFPIKYKNNTAHYLSNANSEKLITCGQPKYKITRAGDFAKKSCVGKGTRRIDNIAYSIRYQ